MVRRLIVLEVSLNMSSRLNDLSMPLPGSRKVYVVGSEDSIRVPMREVVLTPNCRAQKSV